MKLIDSMDFDEAGVKLKFKDELKRFNEFQKIISGETTTEPTDQLDIKTDAKYVLKTGSIIEKRELLSSLKSRVVYEDKKIFLKP